MPYLFLHGLGQAPGSWEAVSRLLDLEPLCPDLAKLGCTYSGLYGEISRLCQETPGPLHLCGLSLGGMLALQYAAEHPERTASLVLIGAQPSAPKGLLRLQNALFRLMPASAFSGSGFSKAGMLALCRSMMDLDLRQAMGRVECPALAVCGERDRANRRAAEELAAGLPHGRLEYIPQAGHTVNTDAAEVLAQILENFYHEVIDHREGNSS